jgi:hypothetical protein
VGMQLKAGVKLSGVRPELVLALGIAAEIYQKYFSTVMTVTSVKDGSHRSGSKHYIGCAADLRIWGLEGRVTAVVDALRASLGEDFDVVPEGDHIHLEFAPKGA